MLSRFAYKQYIKYIGSTVINSLQELITKDYVDSPSDIIIRIKPVLFVNYSDR